MSQIASVRGYMDDKLYQAARLQDVDISYNVNDDEFFCRLTPYDQSNVLHVASRCGNQGFILTVLGQVPVTSHYELLCKHNSKGETPLHLAAQSGDKGTVEALLLAHDNDSVPLNKKKPCWRERDKKGDTPLHRALKYGHDDIAMLLLERDRQLLVFLDNNVGESPAYLAADNFCMKFLKAILGADNDSKFCASFSGPYGQTVFHPARRLSGNILSKLIEKKIHLLQAKDNKGKTVLHYAVEENRKSIVDTLLKADTSLAYLLDDDGLTPLHKATSMGLFSMIQTILELSPQSITICDTLGRTALHVVNMDACLLEECLWNTRMKELINEVDNDGNTPLHIALMNSDIVTADKLLEVDDINWRLVNNQGYSPMDLCTSDDQIPLKLKRLAAAHREKEVMNMEIFFHKDVVNIDDILDHCTLDECLTYRGPEGDTILHIASRDGHMKIINQAIIDYSTTTRLLLLSGQNFRGETPLHLAAEHGQLEVVNSILSLCSRVDRPESVENPATIVSIENGNGNLMANLKPCMMKSANGDTPAHKAIRNRHANIALLLLRRDPKLISFINNAKESLLYLAADTRCYEVLKGKLMEDIEYDYSITSGRCGQNIVHAAARSGGLSFELCKSLISRQPDLLRKIDDSGKTPLHYAANYGRAATVRWLLKQDKAAAFVYDNEGFTPLLRASVLCFHECVRSILDICPHSAELRDLSNKRTMLHLAKIPCFFLQLYMKNQVMVKLVNEVDMDGNTALHCAILDGDIDKALILLKTEGVNWRIRNKQHQSPMDLCRELNKSGKTEQRPIHAVLESLDSGEITMRRATKLISWVKSQVMTYNDLILITDDNLKKLLDNIAVAAALLVTITFAAAFTVPGGYDQNTGEAMRMKEVAVKVFIASDVLAMLMGISILVWYTVGVVRRVKLRKLAIDSIIMLQISLVATIVAFISGAYAIVLHFESVIAVPIVITALFNLLFYFRSEFMITKFYI